jgi:hypothetical protein
MQDVKISRDTIAEKKNSGHLDLYYDALWVKHLTKAITDLGSGVGALIYKEMGMILFFYNQVIFYKVMMNETNESLIPIEIHAKRAKRILTNLKEGKIQTHIVGQSQEQFKKLNTQSAVKK